ncbi:hypothetical protein D3C81_1656730 [compost metagenome]
MSLRNNPDLSQLAYKGRARLVKRYDNSVVISSFNRLHKRQIEFNAVLFKHFICKLHILCRNLLPVGEFSILA